MQEKTTSQFNAIFIHLSLVFTAWHTNLNGNTVSQGIRMLYKRFSMQLEASWCRFLAIMGKDKEL